MEEKYVLDFLQNENNYYLINNDNNSLKKITDFLPKDFCLYHIEELTFEEKSPRKEALENVLSALRLDGLNFLYLIVGDKGGVHFYFGVVKNLCQNKNIDLEIDDIGKDILKPSITGNFRGSKITELRPKDKLEIKSKLNQMSDFGILEGVPGINKDNENFQGVDRLVDVMLGDDFVVAVIASPLNQSHILEIERNLYKAYSSISPLSKKTVQEGETLGTSFGNTKTESFSETDGVNNNTSKTQGTSESHGSSNSENTSKSTGNNQSNSNSKNTSTTQGTNTSSSSSGTNKSATEGTSTQKTSGTSEQLTTGTSKQTSDNQTLSKSNTISEGINKSTTKGTSLAVNDSKSESKSNNITIEISDKEAQEWLKYIDEVILPRLDYGKSKGVFITTTFLATNNRANLIKLGNTIKSLYSGKEGNKVPLDLHILKNKNYLNLFKNFQIPQYEINEKISKNEITSRTVVSQYISDDDFFFGNWLSTNELGLIAGLPQKEVVGLSLKEEVEFGLNFKNNIEEENKIDLGILIQSGRELDIGVYLDKSDLNKHIFITGVTGSGKTTTCHKILMKSELPFMVIEPAKTEYRILTESFEDILVFTLGKDSIAPFRLNPFEFCPHENISSRVDMIKASLEASFDMEAAIPQIIEAAIYECYEDYGWNIATNKNEKYLNPFDDGMYTFPTLSDLIKKIDDVVIRQGFDERLKNDYIGSIKARLQGLIIGSKGLMLNTKRSLNFEELVNRKVILELDEIKNTNEKSLVMGFILTNLNEAIKANYLKNSNFKHITLIEEAHRLLSKYTPGDSQNKKQGVEVFTDMLAEVRKYGESLIIVDQIPNKLTPEVLKNTNTKIVHKLFAQDDKEAIGNTMALSDEQKEFMSSLEVGRAIISSQGWSKALQVQIRSISNTSCGTLTSEESIRKSIISFYKKSYKRGVLEGLETLENEPDMETVEKYLEFVQDGKFAKEYQKFVIDEKSEFDFKGYMVNKGFTNHLELLASYLSRKFYIEEKDISIEERKNKIIQLLQDIMDNKLKKDENNKSYIRLINNYEDYLKIRKG